MFLLLLFVTCNLFLFNQYVFTNISQPNTGHTGAPGEQTCATSGCHQSATIPVTFQNPKIQMPGPFAGNFVNGYLGNEGDTFNLQLAFSQIFPTYNIYGFSMTALYENGTPAGVFYKGLGSNGVRESLSTSGGRQYLGHKDADSNPSWLFKYELPAAPITQDIIFYIAANGGNDNGQADAGDDIYVAKYRLSANDFKLDTTSGPVANVTAEFDVNSLTPCLGKGIAFNDLSTGNPTTYFWDFGPGATPSTSSSATPPLVSYSTPGPKTISLTVSAGGASDTETKVAYVNVSAGPNIDAGQDQSMCVGGSVQLQATGGVLYSWSPVSGLSSSAIANPVASPANTTVYTVTGTDASGCANSDDVTVTVTNAPVVNVIDADICPGDTAVLDAGNPGFDYLWSDNSTGQTLAVTQSGFYSVTVSDGVNCSASDTAEVVLLPLPTADAGSDQEICLGDAAQIGSNSFPSYNYRWVPASSLNNANISNPLASPTVDTEYILTVNNQVTGCVARDSVIVTVNPLPIVLVSGLSPEYCVSDNTPISLNLSPAGGVLSGPGISGTDFIPANAGLGTHLISYEYTDPVTNCTNSANIGVDVVPAPVAGIINLSTEYCEYDTAFALIGIPAGGSFNIDGQIITDFDPQNLGAGTYEVEYIVSVGSCIDSTSMMVDVIGNVSPSISLPTSIFCKGDNTPYSFQASPGGGTVSGFGVVNGDFIPTAAGVGSGTIEYVFDTASCQFATSITVTVAGVDLGNDTTICEGDSVLLDVSVFVSNILWSNNAQTPTIKVSPLVGTSVEYFVTGTDINGCTTSDTIEVTTAVKPNVIFDNIDSLYCSTDPILTLVGSPVGGVFSGPGVSGNTFDPNAAGVGGPYTLTYTYQGVGGCEVSVSQGVAVLQGFSNPEFIGLDTIYCVNASAVELNGTPAGGSFSGNGVIDSTFVPYFAGVGIHTLTYGVQSGNGCGAIKTVQVEVKARPQVQFNTLPSAVCSNSGSLLLEGLPSGGVFSGAGVQDTVFYPSRVGVGNTNIISYTYTDIYGCSRKIDQIVDVLPKPNASILSHPRSLCEGADTVNLNGQPFGGVFMINGDTSNQFVPNASFLGSNIIQYIVTANNTCKDTAYSSIRVWANPNVQFDIVEDQFCAYPIITNLSATPVGGVFEGTGVGQNNVFSPVNADLGVNVISYTYIDSNGCGSTVYDSVEIVALPEVELTGLNDVYCTSDDSVAFAVNPVGGTLSGAGVSGNYFIPSEAGVGTFNVRYTVVNSSNCYNVLYKEIRVDDCTSVIENNDLQSILIWPNPTNGFVYVESPVVEEQVSIRVLDLQGRLLFETSVAKQDNLGRFEIDLSNFNSGIYLIQLQNKNESVVKRIVRY